LRFQRYFPAPALGMQYGDLLFRCNISRPLLRLMLELLRVCLEVQSRNGCGAPKLEEVTGASVSIQPRGLMTRISTAARPCITRMPIVSLVLMFILAGTPSLRAHEAVPTPQNTAAKSTVGTIQSISGKSITLKADSGASIIVLVQEGARLLRITPGEKNLRNAVPLELGDLQPGDRILVRGKLSEDGASLAAVSVIAMKETDIAQKQAHEREEWQKHSIGGLVSSLDPAAGTITITATSMAGTKTVAIHVSKDTVLRRYAPNSIKFDDAKPAPLDAVKAGDQLRARGKRSADGGELSADEIVSGSFRNIVGTVSAVDSATGTITVADLATKKSLTVKMRSDSQLRKLPTEMAQRIAARLKGTPSQSSSATPASQKPAAPASANPGGPASHGEEARSQGGSSGGGDLQQAIDRMPAVNLSDLRKGDAVMIVTTTSSGDDGITAITLLAGVEPILQASPKNGQSILSAWSLGGAPGGDAP
jgi:hypothetical protein